MQWNERQREYNSCTAGSKWYKIIEKEFPGKSLFSMNHNDGRASTSLICTLSLGHTATNTYLFLIVKAKSKNRTTCYGKIEN